MALDHRLFQRRERFWLLCNAKLRVRWLTPKQQSAEDERHPGSDDN